MRPLLLAIALLPACIPELWGDAHRVQLGDELGWTAEVWTPAYPIASGTTFQLNAIGWEDSSGEEHDYGPNAFVTSSDTGVIEVVTNDEDRATLSARGQGRTKLSWTGGDADDTMNVQVAIPAVSELRDPAIAGFELLAVAYDATILDGDAPEDLGLYITILEGAAFDAWARLASVSLTSLAFSDDALTATGAIVDDDHVYISAESGDAIDVLVYGSPLPPTFYVARAPVEDIASLELVVVDLGKVRETFAVDLAVLAVARDAAGNRVLQPPVTWTIPDGMEIASIDDQLDSFGYQPRPDLVFLNWTTGSGPFEVTIGASVGAVATTSTVTATMEGKDENEQDEPPTDEEDSTCCCGSGGSAMVLLLVIPGLVRRRAR